MLKPDIHSSVNKNNKTNHFVSLRSYLKNFLLFFLTEVLVLYSGPFCCPLSERLGGV